MDLRDLSKSAFSLPWALTMFGAQQATNLVWPSAEDRLGSAGRALDAVSDAAAGGLDGWARDTYEIADAIQQALVDLALLRLPSLDTRSFTPVAALGTSTPLLHVAAKYGLPPIGWADSLLVPRVDAPATIQEFRNKLAIILQAIGLQDALSMGSRDGAGLTALVTRCADLPTFPRLWAIEGVGHHVANRALAESGASTAGVFAGPEAEGLPRWSQAMLHAGAGTAFARFALKELKTGASPDAVRRAVDTFAALCRASARPGYEGAAFASLGVSARMLRPDLVRPLDAALADAEPGLLDFFWHGVGRALYFDPAFLLPSTSAPWRALRRLDDEATRAEMRANVVAGFIWSLTAANLAHPIVMEAFLRHHGPLGSDHDAFTGGVVASVLVRYDATRDDSRVMPFVRYAPAETGASEVWRARITEPCESALREAYPRLREARRLEDLFRLAAG